MAVRLYCTFIPDFKVNGNVIINFRKCIFSRIFKTGIGIDNRSNNPAMASNGAVSKTPEGQAENVIPNTNVITDEKIMMLTEELFEKQDRNFNHYVDLNLQRRITNTGQEKVPDEAPEPYVQ